MKYNKLNKVWCSARQLLMYRIYIKRHNCDFLFYLFQLAPISSFTRMSKQENSLWNPVVSSHLCLLHMCKPSGYKLCICQCICRLRGPIGYICWQRELYVIQNAKMDHFINTPRGTRDALFLLALKCKQHLGCTVARFQCVVPFPRL